MKKILSLILVLVLVLGSMPLVFADENMTGGENLYELGLVKGDEEGNLMEDQMLTREQMMVMLARLNDVEGEAMDYDLPSTFNDVNADSYYAPYIAYAEVQEWTNGTGDGTFTPKGEVTAQMVATYMMRVLGYEVNWDTAVVEAAVLGIMDDNPTEKFLRGNAFDMMYDAVNTKMANSEMTLGQKLGKVAMEEEVVAEDVMIESAVALNSQVVEVSLDEDMDAPEMVDASIFMVTDEDDAELTIESAVFAPWDADDYTVLVTVEEELEAGSAYAIASGDTSADFGGMPVDEDEPTVDDVTSTDYNKVEITFNEAVMIDDLTVEIAEKYGDKDDLAVLDFEYDGSDTIVVTTSEQASATLYAVTVDGAVDLAGNAMEEDDSQTFTGQEMDTDEQTVVSVSGHDSLTVKVTFRTKVEEDAALDAANYSIAEKYGDKDEVPVVSVEMEDDDDDTTVDESKTIAVLTLGDHTQEATLYELEVNDVGTLYGEPMDTDNNTATFTGVGEDTDAPDAISAESTSNTEVVITVTDDSDIAEDVDAGLFTIAEKYGDKDELVVIAVKEVDGATKEITLTTSEQSEATLYEVTVAEGLADKFGNVTDEELDATFTGSGVADAIESVTATNTADKKVRVDFDQNYGSGALSIVNYKIDGGIGYPTKVEDIDNDDDSVMLTVSELEIGTIYELTVKNVKNSDGVAMDSDGVTDKFAGKYGSSDSAITLEAVVATDDQTLKLYFDKDVEDLVGVEMDGTDLSGDEFLYDLENDSPDAGFVVINGYAYEDANNSKVLIVTADTAGVFNNADGDEITLKVDDTVVTNIDADDDANEVVFAENTNEADDIVIEGVVALDSYTLKVYFNQAVRNMNEAAFAKITDDDGDFASFNDAYDNNDEMTEWIFVMDTQMVDATDSKLDFVVIDGTESEISTHALSASKVEYSTDTDDMTVEFSKNTSSTNYMEDIGVAMLDSKTVKVFFPEAMDLTDDANDSILDGTSSDVFDFDKDSDAVDENPTNADESNITQVVWDSATNSATLTLDTAFGTTDGTKLYLGFAKTLANKANTKTVMTEDGDKLWQEFSVSTKDAAEIAINDVTANIENGSSAGEIVITLDQAIGSGSYSDATEFLTDFEIKIGGEKLLASDIAVAGFTENDAIDDPDITNTNVLNNLSLSEFRLELADVFIGVDDVEATDNDTVEVEIIDSTQSILGAFNNEGLEIDATAVASLEDMNADSAAPTQTSITYKDTDSNGTIDSIELLFNESIKASTVAISDFTFSATDKLTTTGNATVALAQTTVSNDTIVITLDEGETAAGTVSTDEIAYAADAFDDLNGNGVGVQAATTMTDGAAPVLLTATLTEGPDVDGDTADNDTIEADDDATTDTVHEYITLTFSENLDGATVDTTDHTTDFTLTGFGAGELPAVTVTTATNTVTLTADVDAANALTNDSTVETFNVVSGELADTAGNTSPVLGTAVTMSR